MLVKFWGVRGSIPTTPTQPIFQERLRAVLALALERRLAPGDLDDFMAGLPESMVTTVGGNTPCVEVLEGKSRLVIDAGTGLNALGQDLTADSFPSDADKIRYFLENPSALLDGAGSIAFSKKKFRLSILLTHTHWDHIQGFPFFAPVYHRGSVIDVYGQHEDKIRRHLTAQQASPELFPVDITRAGADVRFHTFPEAGLTLGPFRIASMDLPHPGGCLCFKIESKKKTAVFATDYEFAENDPASDKAKKDLFQFIHNADVFISDTQYTFLESMTKEGWGHSSSLRVAEMALKAGVRKLFLFHHDPAYSDRKLFDMLQRTVAYTNLLSNGHAMEIKLAIEGQSVEI
ncbi:MAG: MBL fold metallo-hydrolase [Deltaproteobacteria bacterium]|jgi:phosphoribosyl 1,2-cyclic phosphodiesterase|nr:MBL fold metallo-hydrolase [Deltaproteobacteria bacterium]